MADIIIDLNGIFLLIEGKYPGHREELKRQAVQRIDEGLCDIVVMVEYAKLNISSTLLPTQKEIKEALRNGKFNVGFITFIERVGLEKWLRGGKKIATSQFYENIDFKDLLAYILTVYDYVVREDVIGPVVSKLENSVLLFAERVLRSGVNVERVKRALELEEGGEERGCED